MHNLNVYCPDCGAVPGQQCKIDGERTSQCHISRGEPVVKPPLFPSISDEEWNKTKPNDADAARERAETMEKARTDAGLVADYLSGGQANLDQTPSLSTVCRQLVSNHGASNDYILIERDDWYAFRKALNPDFTPPSVTSELTDAYGLPNDLHAAKEEIHEWREAIQAFGVIGGPDTLRKLAVELAPSTIANKPGNIIRIDNGEECEVVKEERWLVVKSQAGGLRRVIAEGKTECGSAVEYIRHVTTDASAQPYRTQGTRVECSCVHTSYGLAGSHTDQTGCPIHGQTTAERNAPDAPRACGLCMGLGCRMCNMTGRYEPEQRSADAPNEVWPLKQCAATHPASGVRCINGSKHTSDHTTGARGGEWPGRGTAEAITHETLDKLGYPSTAEMRETDRLLDEVVRETASDPRAAWRPRAEAWLKRIGWVDVDVANRDQLIDSLASELLQATKAGRASASVPPDCVDCDCVYIETGHRDSCPKHARASSNASPTFAVNDGYRDLRCPDCGEMMTSHVVVTRHATGPCDEQYTGPELRSSNPITTEERTSLLEAFDSILSDLKRMRVEGVERSPGFDGAWAVTCAARSNLQRAIDESHKENDQ